MSFPRMVSNKTPMRLLLIAAAVMAIALLVTACGSSNEPQDAAGGSDGASSAVTEPAGGNGSSPSAAGQEPGASASVGAPASQTDPGIYASLSGDIAIDGSSTVFPITEAVAVEFGGLTDGNVRTVVGISGTGGGFNKFCTDETVISDASRPITQKEIELCEAEGIEYIELPVAIDGLSVLVNPANDFVECMTVEQLNMIWSPEAEGVVTHWNQVDPTWPAEEIKLYAPGVDSGTFDYFTEAINGDGGVSRGDFVPSEDDNVLVQGITGDRYSLGYFGYAYYVENLDKLKAVAIDGGNGCIAPSDAAINNGTYAPLSRPLFIYVRADAATEPHIAEFVKYYLGTEGRNLAASVGYIPFPGEIYDLVLAKLNAGTTGTVFGGNNAFKGSVAEGLTR